MGGMDDVVLRGCLDRLDLVDVLDMMDVMGLLSSRRLGRGERFLDLVLLTGVN